MRKAFIATATAIILGVASYAAISAADADRPPGVEAANWIALGPNWGFVIDPTWSGMQPAARSTAPAPPVAMPSDRTALYVTTDVRSGPPTLRGSFAAKHDGAWARLSAVPIP